MIRSRQIGIPVLDNAMKWDESLYDDGIGWSKSMTGRESIQYRPW